MTKRVFLYATGSDFSAMDFEKYDQAQEIYEEMIQADVNEKVFESDDYYFEVKILEFGVIDDKFIDFIRDEIMDYDQAKASDFFEVKPV